MFKIPSIIPRDENFFDLFEESTHNMVKAALALKNLTTDWQDVDGKVKEISRLEGEGDRITHTIMDQLHRTFVTPFDREDIAVLAHALDDVTDFIDAAADAMLIYKVEQPTTRANELANTIVQAAVELEKAIPHMRHHADLKKVLPCCVEINRLENSADEIYHMAMVELFNDSNNVANIIKWREIYEDMESATDRCEDVSNVLEGVALKNG